MTVPLVWNFVSNVLNVLRGVDAPVVLFASFIYVWLLHPDGVLFRVPSSAAVVGILAGAWRAQAVQWLPSERVHTLGVVLEINKAVAIVQFHLKLPQHGKPQKAGKLRPGVAAYGGEVQRDNV